MTEIIKESVNHCKNNKAVGVEGEVIKLTGRLSIAEINSLCDIIWRTGKWPKKLCTSILLNTIVEFLFKAYFGFS